MRNVTTYHNMNKSPEGYGYTLLKNLGKYVLKDQETKTLLSSSDSNMFTMDVFTDEKTAKSKASSMKKKKRGNFDVRTISPVFILEQMRHISSLGFNSQRYMGFDWMPKGHNDHSMHYVVMGTSADEKTLSRHLGEYVLKDAEDGRLYTSEPCYCSSFNADFFSDERKASSTKESLKDMGIESKVRFVSPVFILEYLHENHGHKEEFDLTDRMALRYCEGATHRQITSKRKGFWTPARGIGPIKPSVYRNNISHPHANQ